MYYAVTHLTAFSYSETITDTVMQLRMQPRSDDLQTCVRFELRISPKARALSHRDYLGNTIHQFDIPARHRKLAVRAESVVETKHAAPLPAGLGPDAWARVEAALDDRDLFDMILPSHFARPSEMLAQFIANRGIQRGPDPLRTLVALNRALYSAFEYAPNVTKVDSPIEHALEEGKGVCQDFAHIMIALVRGMRIPCRYVSGYLYYRSHDRDRTSGDRDRSSDGATHAWVEAWLPDLGWVGFDPTNDLICGDRHIRVAVGRDYDDVPPTRGVFTGEAESSLDVSVKVSSLPELPVDGVIHAPEIALPQYDLLTYQQQQQQQQ
ncbi:MAG: transglutaminase family protein [Chloroflexi bacterium]|nr:transglutaminase family protein [Chloroflexota bacterium]